MKSYAEILKSNYIGKNGDLRMPGAIFIFSIKKADLGSDNCKLVDVGTDYVEFSCTYGQRFVPLSLLVLDVE